MFEGFKKKIAVGLTGLTMAGGMKAESANNAKADKLDQGDNKEIKFEDTRNKGHEEGTYVIGESENKTIAEQIKTKEVEQEKNRLKLLEAQKHLDTLRQDFKSEIYRLKEFHQGNKDMQKLLKSIEGLDGDIHAFVSQILESKKESMGDLDFRAKVPEGLARAVLDGDNPPGHKVVNFGVALNSQVAEYRGEDGGDIAKRLDLSSSLPNLAKAEWEVYLAEYLYNTSEQELASLKTALANESKTPNTDMASVESQK